jgi:hypothetical protein
MTVYIAIWQARDRVAVFAANLTLEGAVVAAQEYGNRLNAQNSAYHLHVVPPEAKHHLARWEDYEGSHAIFIVAKEVAA